MNCLSVALTNQQNTKKTPEAEKCQKRDERMRNRTWAKCFIRIKYPDFKLTASF